MLSKNQERLKHGNPCGDPASAPRCGAKTRNGGKCRAPAMFFEAMSMDQAVEDAGGGGGVADLFVPASRAGFFVRRRFCTHVRFCPNLDFLADRPLIGRDMSVRRYPPRGVRPDSTKENRSFQWASSYRARL